MLRKESISIICETIFFYSFSSHQFKKMIDKLFSFFHHLIIRAVENFFLLFKLRDEPIKEGENDKEGINRNGIRKPVNPISLLARLEFHHWLALFIGFLAVYVDLLDVSERGKVE